MDETADAAQAEYERRLRRLAKDYRKLHGLPKHWRYLKRRADAKEARQATLEERWQVVACAALQDAVRRWTTSTRYDVNIYGRGTPHIGNVGVIKRQRRK